MRDPEDTTYSDDRQATGLIKNQRAFWLLCLVLVSIIGAVWLLATVATYWDGASPPWLVYLLILFSVLALLWSPGQASQAQQSPEPGSIPQSIPRPQWSSLSFAQPWIDASRTRVFMLIAVILSTAFILNQLSKLGRVDDYMLVTIL